MPRRGDNIRKRKDGRWEARYPLTGLDEKTKKYGSVYGKTYQEAKEKRDLIIKKGIQMPLSGGISFKELLEAWQDANRVRIKEASVSRYQNLIDAHILPYLGSKKVNQINTLTINRFLTSKLENGRLDGTGGLSATYVRSITLIISSAIKFGATERLCEPLLSPITKPSIAKKELCTLCLAHQTLLEQGLLNDLTEVKLLIYITLYTGLRIGEACALRWENIDLEAKILFVRQTVSRVWYSENGKKISKLTISSPKTGSSMRSIPICSKLYEVIKHFPNRKKHGYVLPGNDGTSFISPRTYEYRYKKLLNEYGLNPVNYHALRHTFATRCIERGVDIKSLSEILGHTDASITLNTYVHSSMELKRLQLEKLVI